MAHASHRHGRAIRRVSGAAAAGLVLMLGAAACGSDEDGGDGERSDDATTATDATGEGDTGGTSTSPETSTLESVLLTAEEMPGINEETSWREDGTGPEDDDGVSECQQGDLASLGADDAIAREFEDDLQNASSGQVLASFPDAAAAKRAHRTVQTWLRSCADRHDDDVVKVSKPRTVEVPGGTAQVVLAQHGDRDHDEHEWDDIGVVLHGTTLTIVQIDVESVDFNFEPGQEPAVRAVKAIAGKLDGM